MEYVARAVFSRISLSDREHELSKYYYETVCDLLEAPEVRKLDGNLQHLNTSRLQHSVNVSFYSFRLARLLGADMRAAARAGLLHDMYYYDYKNTPLSMTEHSSLHSRLALINAKRVTQISDAEEDIILTHMWPMTKAAPKSKEGYIVSFVDKFCTLLEIASKVCMH